MAAGLAVVCFDKENNRNYLGAGGYFCNQRSAQGIADGIAYFLNQPEEIAKKGAMNKNKAQEFSWDKAGNKIDVIYKNLLQK
jgi:glycosyltransferase involved in cell wall biosynthesis